MNPLKEGLQVEHTTNSLLLLVPIANVAKYHRWGIFDEI